MLREKLYSEEMDIKQLQADLAVIARGNDILKCKVQNALDALSYATSKFKYLELQELGVMKAILPKVFQERDFMWEEVKSYSEMNMLLNYEINILKRKGSASTNVSICWFTCSTSCVFYPVWSDSKGIKLAWGYNISCPDNPWYFGHYISYAVVASVMLGAAVSQHLSVTYPLAARRDALKSTVICLREGFCRKDQNSSASSSEGCGSSVKHSSCADAGHLGNATVPCTGDGSTWNNIEGINSDKSIDSGRPSLAIRSSSCHSVVQEPEILDLNLALAFQEKLSDPRITSMLKRKGRHTDRELANLLQDKGLDPNFAVMVKKNGLDPMILALLQRSSLEADREHRDSAGLSCYCKCSGQPDPGSTAAGRLKNLAYDWVVAWRKGRGKGAIPTTWQEFQDAFLDKFFPLEIRNAKVEEFMNLRQGSMTVRKYCLKFNQVAKYAPDLVADNRASMSKFVTRVFRYVVKECRYAMLNSEINLSRLITHAQQIEADKIKEKDRMREN
ncbi:hypothetical protein FXO37_09257 [Capsicum annuum]|nr:hypothetical protein FXO37_09257 [Capsicum annuum]